MREEKAANISQLREMHAQKTDSRQSLVTLVKAIDSAVNPDIQKALIIGIILGLEGQRDVKPQ